MIQKEFHQFLNGAWLPGITLQELVFAFHVIFLWIRSHGMNITTEKKHHFLGISVILFFPTTQQSQNLRFWKLEFYTPGKKKT